MGKAGGGALIALGLIGIIIGGFLFASYQGDHATCENEWVRLLAHEKCEEVDFFWTIGLIGVIVGIVLLIIGAAIYGRP